MVEQLKKKLHENIEERRKQTEILDAAIFIQDVSTLSKDELIISKINFESQLEDLKLSNLNWMSTTLVVTMCIASFNFSLANPTDQMTKSILPFIFVLLFLRIIFFLVNSRSKTSATIRNTVKQIKSIEYELQRREEEKKKLDQRTQEIADRRERILNQKYRK